MIRYYLLIMGIFLAFGLIPKSHRLMNALAAGNGMLHLVVSCVALSVLDLPGRLGESLYLDHLNLYVELITALGFTAAAFYARGYTDSLMEAGELDPKPLADQVPDSQGQIGVLGLRTGSHGGACLQVQSV